MINKEGSGLSFVDSNTGRIFLTISRYDIKGTANPPKYIKITDAIGRQHYANDNHEEYHVFDKILTSKGL